MSAARWQAEVLPTLVELEGRRGLSARLWGGFWSVFRRHPVDVWLERHGQGLSQAERRALRFAYSTDHRGTRGVLDAWGRLPAGVLPRDAARAVLRDVYRHGPAVRRDVLALRAVQSLAVLDVRNYRDLVFRIGEFEQGGEDPELGRALP